MDDTQSSTLLGCPPNDSRHIDRDTENMNDRYTGSSSRLCMQSIRGLTRAGVAWMARSWVTGTAWTAMSSSSRRKSYVGSLKGLHSIWELFHSSLESLSDRLVVW